MQQLHQPNAPFATNKYPRYQQQIQQNQQENVTAVSDKDQSVIVGVQAQNLYLINYINKLEFLLLTCVRDKKREKKRRCKQLNKIVKAVSQKPNVCSDKDTLLHYLRVNQGIDIGEVREIESAYEDDEELDSSHESLNRKLFRREKEYVEKQDPLIQLLTPALNNSGRGETKSECEQLHSKSEKDLKLEYKKKEQQILDKYQNKCEDSVERVEEVINKIKDQRQCVAKDSNNDDKQIGTLKKYLKESWEEQAKITGELLQDFKE